MISRRTFLKNSLTAAACASVAGNFLPLHAEKLELPLGLQLFSLRAQLPKDYDGTLRQLGALGYREVEAAGFFDHTAAQVKQSMKAAGLTCVSAHYPYLALDPHLDEVVQYARDLGLKYVICSVPGVKNPVSQPLRVPGSPAPRQVLTLEDWRWNAEQFNRIGERFKKVGIQFGYHNHFEFKPENGVVPFDELLRLTDPKLVTMQLDCGNMIEAGQSPVAYLERYPTRFSMLHLKDSTPPARGSESATGQRVGGVPTEMGRGIIDYRPIFKAATKIPIKHCFMEQEGYDMPPFESLKVDADYIRNLEF
jgi:sugar phosphate isomerase/epimerase